MNIGLSALEEGGRIDFDRLRADRRRRLLEAMAAADLDAVVLSRPGNVRYASGARQLWTAGSRPFSPLCVVAREPAEVRLLSVWAEGVPREIPVDHLYGLSWDPIKLGDAVGRIPGLVAGRRVGTDGRSPTFGPLLASVVPRAEIVDATGALWAARQVKTPEEVACIATAGAVSEAALAAVTRSIEPGMTGRRTVGRLAEHVAGLGGPILANEGVAWATGRSGPADICRVADDRPFESGDLVALDPGVLYAGYEGGVGRTVVVGGPPGASQQRLAERCRHGLAAVIERCRAGGRGEDLRAAWATTGAPIPPVLVHGLGQGVEPPLVGAVLGGRAELSEGSVLAVQGWVAEHGVGGCYERDVVVVTAGAPRILTRSAPGLQAAGLGAAGLPATRSG
jgi:Xaa-Pro aminopeptidase